MLRKQQIAEERLAEQRRRQEYSDMIRREQLQLRKLSKDFNVQRSMRKHEFQREILSNKLDQDKAKHEALIEERRVMSQLKMDNLVKSEIQRSNIKNALY